MELSQPILIVGRLAIDKYKGNRMIWVEEIEVIDDLNFELDFISQVKKTKTSTSQPINQIKSSIINDSVQAKYPPKLKTKLPHVLNINEEELNDNLFEIYLKNFIQSFTESHPLSRISLISLKFNYQLRVLARRIFNKRIKLSKTKSTESKFKKIERLFIMSLRNLIKSGSILVYDQDDIDHLTIDYHNLPPTDTEDELELIPHEKRYEYYKPVTVQSLSRPILNVMKQLNCYKYSFNNLILLNNLRKYNQNYSYINLVDVNFTLKDLILNELIEKVNENEYKLL